MTDRDPYVCWVLEMPFDKQGAPFSGLSGRSVRAVVVMEPETFKRMIEDNPSLRQCEFKIGTRDGGDS